MVFPVHLISILFIFWVSGNLLVLGFLPNLGFQWKSVKVSSVHTPLICYINVIYQNRVGTCVDFSTVLRLEL